MLLLHERFSARTRLVRALELFSCLCACRCALRLAARSSLRHPLKLCVLAPSILRSQFTFCRKGRRLCCLVDAFPGARRSRLIRRRLPGLVQRGGILHLCRRHRARRFPRDAMLERLFFRFACSVLYMLFRRLILLLLLSPPPPAHPVRIEHLPLLSRLELLLALRNHLGNRDFFPQPLLLFQLLLAELHERLRFLDLLLALLRKLLQPCEALFRRELLEVIET